MGTRRTASGRRNANLIYLFATALFGACGGSPGDLNGSMTGGGKARFVDCDKALVSATLGLVLLGRERQPNSGTGQSAGHLNQLLLDGDVAWLSNAQDFIASFRLAPDGGVSVLRALPANIDPKMLSGFCMTLALHAPSRRMFCGNLTSVHAFDAPPSGATVLHASDVLPIATGARDLLVLDDDLLLLARQRDGLSAASIARDGSLSNHHATTAQGDIRRLGHDGAHLVALDQMRGLVALRRTGDDLVETGVLALDGPMFDVSVRGARAVVALGSAGVAIADLSGPSPSLVSRIEVPGVVTSADLLPSKNLLAAACSSGTFLYDLGASPPRLAGFAPALRNMLSARFRDGGGGRDELVIADWDNLARYEVHAAGHAAPLDIERGQFVPPGHPFSLPVFNRGDLPLEAVAWSPADDRKVASVQVAPGQRALLAIDDETLAKSGTALRVLGPAGYPELDLDVQTRLASPSPGGSACVLDHRVAVLIRRSATADLSRGHPAVSDAAPTIAFEAMGQDLHSPRAGHAALHVFHTFDCAAMWPELEDLAWLSAKGLVPGGAEPVFLTPGDVFWVYAIRGLTSVRAGSTGSFGAGASPPVMKDNATFGRDVFIDGFQLDEIPGGAAHPTDYAIDDAGIVTSISRVYRGRYPLF